MIRPRTAIPGFEFPAIPNLREAEILSLLAQFDESEWWAPDRLRRHQFIQLRTLVQHAKATVPFYAKTLADIPCDTPEALEAAWARIPIIDKYTTLTAQRRMLSTAPPPEHGKVSVVSTSGTTGPPAIAHRTGLCVRIFDALTARDHLWHGRDPSARLASVRDFADPRTRAGITRHGWGAAARVLGPDGPVGMIDTALPLAQQLEWLRSFGPDYLLGYATNLRALALADRGAGGPLLKPRAVMSVGESIDEDLPEVCREIWDAPLQDIYSAYEVGYMAFQCPDGSQYHVPAETVLLEVLDEKGEPCAPGTEGRVVVTPLHNFAMPLLRYDVGDYAVMGEVCGCGRGLPTLKRVLGRTRNMALGPDGARFFPKLGAYRLMEMFGFDRMRMVQTAVDRFRMDVTRDTPLTAADLANVEAHLRMRIPYCAEVSVRQVDDIPRGPGGKLEEFVCEV